MEKQSGGRAHLELPDAPKDQGNQLVKGWLQPVVMSTYLPSAPNKNPMFLEKRVYQGSSGRVYPLPFIDHIATEPQLRTWAAVHLENEFLRIMVLPEIGGRIHVGLDKRNGYDFFYRQNVIKPALVGLAGPWVSGGVEFNWPQHHRPATFSPVSVHLERDPDGSVTAWCSDYDRMSGMKGMHGVCLRPGKAFLELRVRLYNATSLPQTFLWWANAATRVHERYQSFFPEDVHYVADHAKRAISGFPHADKKYYGIDYGERARSGVPSEQIPRQFLPDGSYAADDLSWYANIPVPTSYMVVGTQQDFFGGYDHAARAGIVHVADHHIAPGKKQWTWGNHEFGYAWDRNLTEDDGPYIELMAGVYTDNQPDFSFLAPGETRTFRQHWFPILELGVPQTANLHGALHLSQDGKTARVHINVTADLPSATVRLSSREFSEERETALLAAHASVFEFALPEHSGELELSASVSSEGKEIFRYEPRAVMNVLPPKPASEPGLPHALGSVEELYLTGLHLEQYRHATRSAEPYWREALLRDPLDSRCNNALGGWHLRRGEFAKAQHHFEQAIRRLTTLNPNPYDGEPYYNLGLALKYQRQHGLAYDAFYKAAWNAAWRAPAYFELARLSARSADWLKTKEHLNQCLRVNADHLQARNLYVYALRQLGQAEEASSMLERTRSLDPLDLWSQYLAMEKIPEDGQQRLQLAFDNIAAGLFEDALNILKPGTASQYGGETPILWYTRAWCHSERGELEEMAHAYQEGGRSASDYCFPHRLEEALILEQAILNRPLDAMPRYSLGNLFYDKRRHTEATDLWRQATELDPTFATAWRNLGIASYNHSRDGVMARTCYNHAISADPTDSRVLFERDQLWKRLGESPGVRLAELEAHPKLLTERDDLAVEFATLLNLTGQPQRAVALLTTRVFQPWEGGEGLALDQYIRARLLLGCRALEQRDADSAHEQFRCALQAPRNLGEAAHLLVNRAEIYFWLGVSAAEMNDESAPRWWERAARSHGDFQEMSVRLVSEATFWSALSLRKLGSEADARELLKNTKVYAESLETAVPAIDYFATSLPTMLLFERDLAKVNRVAALYLFAQVAAGLHRVDEARRLLGKLLAEDNSHLGAVDLLHLMETVPQFMGKA